MSESSNELTGPNLKDGVSKENLKSGEKLLGHFNGEPVLLIRDKDEFYAIGGKCTHYGAPLSDGLLQDGCIHCPWHHAAFDIKTGQVTNPPAFNPLPAWTVEVKGDQVFVIKAKESSSKSCEIKDSKHFAIIGGGASGNAAAEHLRQKGFQGKITIFSKDKDLPYDRPNLSKDYLAGNAPEEWMPLRSLDFYNEKKIEIRLNTTVEKINPPKKELSLNDGSTLTYDKCLVATGGSPFKPPMEGLDLPFVHFLRSFEDCRNLIKNLEGVKKIAVVGAGFIGLETAAAFRSRNLDVTIIAPNKFPLDNVMGKEVGAFLKNLHESKGVHFHLGKTVEKIREGEVVLNDGSTEKVDLVLVAIGVRPNIQFLADAGIETNRGVIVNEYLRTSDENIFASGDIALYPNPITKAPTRIEHWAVAQKQGQVAAENMLGLQTKHQTVPFFWSQQFDIVMNYVGHANPFNRTKVYGSLEDHNCAVAYFDKDQVRAVMTIFQDEKSILIGKALEENDQKEILRLLEQ